jgi:VWFA-related protein
VSPLFPFVRARGAAVYVLIAVAIVAVTSGGRAQSPAAAPAQQQPPPFRAGTNFVHVDVYPTANGTTVPDLAAADFEVLEDGVLQKIETFEHVNIQGLTPEEAKAEPTSTREAASMAETTKGRLFVIFLDKYFVNLYGSHDIRRPLVNFLNRLLGPDDMFAVMTPDMSAADLSFARKNDTVEDNLRRFWFWGQKDDNILPDDPTEREVQECYGDSRMPATAINELVERRREKKVIDALTDLTIHLRGVREGRKAVITVTGGWLLFRENKDLNTDPTTGMPKPIPVPPTGITTDGKITTDTSAENLGYSKSQCERDRFWLSTIDDRRDLYQLFDLANRNNVSFYPINPMGLEAGRPIDQDRFVERPNGTLLDPQSALTKSEQDATAPRLATPSSLVEARTENLRELAASTDGIAVVDTNDLDRGMTRIAADLSSYYLLGYASTNAKLDGKFRKITVRVKRAGVDVRARRGYRAPTRKEVEEGATAEAPATPDNAAAAAIQAALDALAPVRPGVPLRTSVSAGQVGGQSHGWLVAELDSSLFRQPEWAGGGVADIAVLTPDETSLASKRGVITSDQRAIVVDLGDLPANGATVRTKVTPQGGGLPYTDTIRFAEATGVRPLLSRRGPTTGVRYMPTAVPQFGRTERMRIEVPVGADTTAVSAEVFDRAGKPVNVPVRASTRVDGSLTWASAEVVLAPLAAGDYLVRLTAGSQSVVTAFRLTP